MDLPERKYYLLLILLAGLLTIGELASIQKVQPKLENPVTSL